MVQGERKGLQTARPKVGPESQGEELGMPKQEEAKGRVGCESRRPLLALPPPARERWAG